MRYTKDIEFNDGRVRFVSSLKIKSVIHLLALALLSAGAIAALSVLTFGTAEEPETFRKIIFGCLTGVFGACFIACITALFLKCRCRYNAVIDDESVFLRYGSGYIRFNRYELGEIKTKSGIFHGRGDKDFEITRIGIKFSFGMKKRFIRISETDKLGYVMANMARFPDRGVDWGVAFESRGGAGTHI